MQVQEAVASRHSVRAFLDKPVDPALIRRLVIEASRSPSGGNLQPWHLHVLAGEPLAELKALMTRRLEEQPQGEGWEYPVYPVDMQDPYKSRSFAVGDTMYGMLGVPRSDKAGRHAYFLRNFQFFGAPVGLFISIDRSHGGPQWADCGMYLQTLMLLLRSHGLDSCAQEIWAMFSKTVGGFLNIPDHHILWTGMSIGYADPDHKINSFISARAPAEEWVEFRGL